MKRVVKAILMVVMHRLRVEMGAILRVVMLVVLQLLEVVVVVVVVVVMSNVCRASNAGGMEEEVK